MYDDEFDLAFTDLDPAAHPPSAACARYMADHGYDADMPVCRCVAPVGFMLRVKLNNPTVANVLPLLLPPHGIVDPVEREPFRVVEWQIGENVVIDVEAELTSPG